MEGLLDGTIDILATDHAPHSAEEKARGLEKAMGVVGLECAFPVLYTGLALTGRAPLATMLRAMTDTPRARFGLPPAGIEPGAGDFAIFDLDKTFTIDRTPSFPKDMPRPLRAGGYGASASKPMWEGIAYGAGNKAAHAGDGKRQRA